MSVAIRGLRGSHCRAAAPLRYDISSRAGALLCCRTHATRTELSLFARCSSLLLSGRSFTVLLRGCRRRRCSRAVAFIRCRPLALALRFAFAPAPQHWVTAPYAPCTAVFGRWSSAALTVFNNYSGVRSVSPLAVSSRRSPSSPRSRTAASLGSRPLSH